MTIVPMRERQSRLPIAGRVRTGIKGKGRPQAIDTFRFTSRHGDMISTLAELYGGDPHPWSDPKSEDRFEVITEASEIRVALPPDPLGETFYELWGGRGLERQCDGLEARCAVRGPDGLEWSPGPCLCRERGVKECKPKLRLAVLLPELPMRGVWRLDSGSEMALDEMPGMVATLQALQGEGLTEGLLRLERRQSQGGAHKFVVPVLGIAESLEGLIAGRARLAALPSSAGGEPGTSGSVPQLPPASEGEGRGVREKAAYPSPSSDDGQETWINARGTRVHQADDEVVEAELIDEPSTAEKARQLRAARHAAILNGEEPPNTWEEIGG